MKLTKLKLIKNVQGNLSKLGYLNLKDTLTGSNGLFAKQVSDNLYLSLGLVISNYYDSQFTASYYLSKTIRWGSVWGDIPKKSYERVGHFLTSEERIIYLDNYQKGEKEADAWWNGNDEKEIEKFFKVIAITENRFLEQEDLVADIENSSEVKELEDYAAKVLTMIESGESKGNYQFVPQKPIDDIPIELFKAAEKVISDEGGILNVNTVKLLAADAWRQKLVIKNLIKHETYK